MNLLKGNQKNNNGKLVAYQVNCLIMAIFPPVIARGSAKSTGYKLNHVRAGRTFFKTSEETAKANQFAR